MRLPGSRDLRFQNYTHGVETGNEGRKSVLLLANLKKTRKRKPIIYPPARFHVGEVLDWHYPAIDMAIRKQKPFWLGQIMAGNRLASFVSTKPQADTRILVDLGWPQKLGQVGAPVDPIARERVRQHMALHWRYLRQTNPTAAKQLAQKIAQMERGAGPPGSVPAGGPAPRPFKL